MIQIPLFAIVKDESFINSLNKLCEQDLPMEASWKLCEVSEKVEEARAKYAELYKKKVEACKTGDTNEDGTAILDEEKASIASKEITEFAKSTMIEVEAISSEVLSGVKLSPVDIKNLCGLVVRK